jgi:hypothetical protein
MVGMHVIVGNAAAAAAGAAACCCWQIGSLSV